MTIRTKVIGLLVALFAVLAAAQYFVRTRILLPSFTDLERRAAVTDMDRVEYAIRDDLEQLEVSARDWANWSQTFTYMQTRRASFITDNFTPDTLKSLKVHVFAIVDLEGRFAWAGGIVLDSGKSLDLDFIARGRLPPGPQLQTSLKRGISVTGLAMTDHGPMLVATSPIVDGNGTGVHRGIVVLGRLLLPDEVKRIGARAQVQLTMLPAEAAAKSTAPTRIVGDDPETLTILRDVVDLNGAPILTLRIDEPRSISASGRATIRYASLFLFGAACIVLVLLVSTLTKLVLNPLASMTRHAVAMGHSDDLTARLDLKRKDELGELANEFDRMVERLTAARRELVDQSFDAGIAEMSREVLHNIGNALTPLCINVSLLQERLRSAPLAETQMALGELGANEIDPARRADLQQFVQLAGQELVRVLTRVLKDLESMEQQTDRIQQSLAEQMKYSRPNRVSETVRLADVVTACAESLPEALRQRLFVQIDDSVAAVGSIHSARTTLQRIFQILMHNAAEAMPAANSGNGRGTLRITAMIEQGQNGEHVRLRFSDDGAGIAPEHLGRLFEKGFSTKSREGKSGVGLHWAANATIALGGSIRAESPGPNRGATIELTIPLQRSGAAARAA